LRRGNPNNGYLPLVVVVDFKHYRGPIWGKQHPTQVPIIPIQKRCEQSWCTQKQIPLHIAWANTIHSVQGHNAGPTAANQAPNAIQIISVHPGDRNYEALSLRLAISRSTTIGCLGHMATTKIPRKCINSAIYFLAGTFPSGIKCLTHAYSKKEEYIKVKKCAVWASHLDKQKKKKHVSDSSVRNGIKKWLKNRKKHVKNYSQLLETSLGEKIIIYTTKEKNLPYTKLQKKLSFLQFHQLSHPSYNHIY
jgi:hypothetical protein